MTMNPILKVLEEGEKEIKNLTTPAIVSTEGDEEVCCNCGEDLSLETYDWFGKGYTLAVEDFTSIQKEQAIKLLEAVNEVVNVHKRTNTYEDDEAIIFKVALEEISDIFTSTINQIKEK